MEDTAKAAPFPEIPQVSCLMPVYNAERFLKQAIDSILNQTFKNFEFIVVDDGSTDATAQILEEYACKDPRIRTFQLLHGGIVSALNSGLLHCRAPYIARMDGDDICMPHRFAFQVDYLDRHPHCAVVGGVFMGLDEDGNYQSPYRFDRNKVTALNVFPVRVALTAHSLAMFRSDILQKLNGYRATFPHAEDYDLFLRIADYGTVDNPDEVLICYRDHAQSISRQNVELQEAAMAYAELAAIEAHRQFQDPIAPNMTFDEACAKLDKQFPKLLIKGYIDFRIWRRLRTVDPDLARTMKWRIVGLALSLRPQTLVSRDFWLLRQRILGRLVLNQITKFRSAFVGDR
jgi:glycosyltransferase involved in cell wall biosynthesis